jgi:hypothetical protein
MITRPTCMVALAGAALLGGLSATQVLAVQASEPTLEDFVWRLATEGPENRVLNNMEIGARAFWAGRHDEARQAFDDCILNIESVFADDQSALRARSVWHEEGAKTFKGEPYERAMVFFYRGLLFLQTADYENARAAFRRGQLQDAFAEEQQNQSDFAILLFLEAWASHLNGDEDLRDEALARVARLRPGFPGIADDADTLVLIESGTAPRKLGDGAAHAYFVYRRGRGFTENEAELVLGVEARPLYPIEDLYFQAATRGGREIDKVLDGKVEFRDATNTFGSALSTTSVVMGHLGGGSDFGAIVGGVGLISLLVSSNARPRADTRQWTSLPDMIHVATFSASSLDGEPRVRLRRRGDPAVVLTQAVQFERDPRGRQLALARSR